jgi:hypothetical protein
MFEACVIITLTGVVAMQWFMSVTYQERFEKIGKLLKKIQETKEDKGHTHSSQKPSIIQGDMDIIHKGRKATVQALIYPRKIK